MIDSSSLARLPVASIDRRILRHCDSDPSGRVFRQSNTAHAQCRPYFENNLLIVGGVFGLDQGEPLFTALLYTTLAAFRGIACVEPTI